MKRIAWVTDIHLNFVGGDGVRAFLDDVASRFPDAVLLGGDIGEATNVVDYLRQMAQAWPFPVFFVLGNHDFYCGSVEAVRAGAARLCGEFPSLHYLTHAAVCELSPTTGLVGHDGWADARLGDYERSNVMLNDYLMIQELANASPHVDPEMRLLDKNSRLPLLRALADAAAEHVRRVLPAALDKYPQVFVLTHVPPFHEACWHEGRLSDDEWLPHFSCKAVGDALLEIAAAYPQRRLTVLCGHTHGRGEAMLLHNLHVLTGGARYRFPEVQRVFEIDYTSRGPD